MTATTSQIMWACDNCQREYSDHQVYEATRTDPWKCSCGAGWKSLSSCEQETPCPTEKTPTHYRTDIQPVDVWVDWNLDPFRATAVKHIARCLLKGDPRGDIGKAIHYLEMYRDRMLPPPLPKVNPGPTPEELRDVVAKLQQEREPMSANRSCVRINTEYLPKDLSDKLDEYAEEYHEGDTDMALVHVVCLGLAHLYPVNGKSDSKLFMDAVAQLRKERQSQ